MYIHIYNGETIISEGDGSSPLVVGPLNASNNEESAPIALTIKCDAGYQTYGNTEVSFVGTTASKWSLCATQDGAYAATLTITDIIEAAGKVIYVKAKATSDESPVNDVSVDINVNATIAAV